MESELGLKHGQILLALASTAELEAIFVRDWPYLDTYKDDVESCLLGGDCSEVENAVAQLNESVVESSLNRHLQPNDDNRYYLSSHLLLSHTVLIRTI